MKSTKSLDLGTLIPTQKKYRKHFELYDFQKLGLFLAEKLKDPKRLSFYIKLAKYENRELLMHAYSYTMMGKEVNPAKTFLWRLQELRKKEKYRLFVAIVLSEKSIKDISKMLNMYKKEFKNIKWGDLSKLHLTLYFNGEFPGTLYFKLTQVVEKLREKYGNEIVLTPALIQSYFNRGRGYIWLTQFNNSIYRYFYGLRKLFLADKQLKQLENTFPKNFSPHITLARLKKQSELKIEKSIDLLLEGNFYVVRSYLTNKGLQYKIHSSY